MITKSRYINKDQRIKLLKIKEKGRYKLKAKFQIKLATLDINLIKDQHITMS
jgi:hypothetical protein